MSFTKFLKQLKKQLRMKRKWLTLAIFIILIGAASAAVLFNENKISNMTSTFLDSELDELTEQVSDHVQNVNALEHLLTDTQKREVIIKRVYVCGEEVESLGSLNSHEILEMYQNNPQYKTFEFTEEGSLVFTEPIEDLSPKCKESAYFGISEDGKLTLFDGLPVHDNVLRTFFQLNIEHLESSLPAGTVQQLVEGIRIRDFEEFNSILSTFSEYIGREN
ncbi:BofC C-terminal domain-containing protein [Chengkuizengella axinellae]|uniref:BofC C-terminal domain-containing protein n=1 Tax=Chengkuizengella axinellae TaxID=3064388 RepID=A0ABT9ITU4_9BACL|nr:BofC C-terminal domain-containing protein [Chengkuizengella sp. 2205SS18-9]MDP5272748.1 BofC C-terminal domain-containing protein [Chengkuizengella sp. 2205SS18-9]